MLAATDELDSALFYGKRKYNNKRIVNTLWIIIFQVLTHSTRQHKKGSVLQRRNTQMLVQNFLFRELGETSVNEMSTFVFYPLIFKI